MLIKILIWLGYYGILSNSNNKHNFLICSSINTTIVAIIKISQDTLNHQTIIATLMSYLLYISLIFVIYSIYFYFLQKITHTFFFYILFLVGFFVL